MDKTLITYLANYNSNIKSILKEYYGKIPDDVFKDLIIEELSSTYLSKKNKSYILDNLKEDVFKSKDLYEVIKNVKDYDDILNVMLSNKPYINWNFSIVKEIVKWNNKKDTFTFNNLMEYFIEINDISCFEALIYNLKSFDINDFNNYYWAVYEDGKGKPDFKIYFEKLISKLPFNNLKDLTSYENLDSKEMEILKNEIFRRVTK